MPLRQEMSFRSLPGSYTPRREMKGAVCSSFRPSFRPHRPHAFPCRLPCLHRLRHRTERTSMPFFRSFFTCSPCFLRRGFVRFAKTTTMPTLSTNTSSRITIARCVFASLPSVCIFPSVKRNASYKDFSAWAFRHSLRGIAPLWRHGLLRPPICPGVRLPHTLATIPIRAFGAPFGAIARQSKRRLWEGKVFRAHIRFRADFSKLRKILLCKLSITFFVKNMV